MSLYLELFHPGKVTSFSHRLAAVPLNLALVPQSILCSGVSVSCRAWRFVCCLLI